MSGYKLNFPVPKPDIARYDAMISRGFERFPKRKINYDKYKANPKSSVLDYMPIKADIENVSRCNLRCGHCLVSTFDGQKRAEDLSFADFKKFIDSQYGLVEIKMQGIGEPFLQKEFAQMVEYAAANDIWVRTTTNGTLLHKNDNVSKIVNSGIGEIQVSIDGATKDTQESIRVGCNFEQLKENCYNLNNESQKTGIDMTRMWSVLQSKNIDEAEEFLNFAHSVGFKRLTLSMELRDWEGHNGLNENNRQKRISETITQEWIDRLLKKADEIGLNLTFWHVSDRFTRSNICFWPFERLLLTSEKKIVPCCIIADPAIFNFGILDDFEKVWFGEEMNSFRASHIAGDIPDICRMCYSI